MLATLALGCGGGLTQTENLSLVVGTWEATQAEWRSPDDALVRVSLSNANGSLTFIVTSDGRYTLRTTLNGVMETETGDIIVGQGDMRLDSDDGSSLSLVFGVQGNTLVLSSNSASFDFDGDGTEEAALFEATLVRR